MQIEVYDKVWIIQNNAPKEMIVFAVVVSMDHGKRSTEKFYHLVEHKVGAGWGNNEGIRRHDGQIYFTREDLIAHL